MQTALPHGQLCLDVPQKVRGLGQPAVRKALPNPCQGLDEQIPRPGRHDLDVSYGGNWVTR